MGIKLSKDAEKAINILREISEKGVEFKEVYDGLDEGEANMVGGIVLLIYSPVGKIACGLKVGNVVICRGLLSSAISVPEKGIELK